MSFESYKRMMEYMEKHVKDHFVERKERFYDYQKSPECDINLVFVTMATNSGFHQYASILVTCYRHFIINISAKNRI